MTRLVHVLALGIILTGCGGPNQDEVPSSGMDREARRKALENMTPEQRAEMRARRQARAEGAGDTGETRIADRSAKGQSAGPAASKVSGAAADAASAGRRGSRGSAQYQNRPVPVAVAQVERGRVDAFYSTTASLSAEEEAVVVARTQGIVEDIFAEEGDAVTEGTALAQLDTRRLELEVARTRTNIESYQRAFDRSEKLSKSNMISPDAYDQSLYALAREKATLALQLYELEEATIRAPIDGIVTIRHIKLGNTLSPNGPAFEIKRATTIEAVLNVPERELIKLARGQLAVVHIDALDDRRFEGSVERVAPEVDASSGTFRVTVQIDNRDNQLKPGMFARVNVRYDSNENTLLVAREAVVTQQNESAVFVVKEGQAMRQPVILGYAMGTQVEILEGLLEGDEVVVTGQGGLRHGAPVRVVTL